MKVEFYIEELVEGNQLVIVFEKSHGKYTQFPIALLKDIKISLKQAKNLSKVLLDTDLYND